MGEKKGLLASVERRKDGSFALCFSKGMKRAEESIKIFMPYLIGRKRWEGKEFLSSSEDSD